MERGGNRHHLFGSIGLRPGQQDEIGQKQQAEDTGCQIKCKRPSQRGNEA